MTRCLLCETIAQIDGSGPAINITPQAGRLLVLTLGITTIVEQGSLELSVWGGSDETDWGAKPLIKFPQKSYCGMYSALLNLSMRPEISHLRVQWKIGRWTKGSPSPLFGFYVDSELSGARIRTAAAGSSDLAAEEPHYAVAS